MLDTLLDILPPNTKLTFWIENADLADMNVLDDFLILSKMSRGALSSVLCCKNVCKARLLSLSSTVDFEYHIKADKNEFLKQKYKKLAEKTIKGQRTNTDNFVTWLIESVCSKEPDTYFADATILKSLNFFNENFINAKDLKFQSAWKEYQASLKNNYNGIFYQV